ncbi:MAG: Gfo/Idh/MocA family protein [Planctomycetota bacterium]
MTQRVPIGVGVIGLGFMGRTHLGAYRAAHAAGFANEIVAVCDSSAERRAGRSAEKGARGNLDTGTSGERLFDPAATRAYEHADELFADARVELVSICTHTQAHVDLALLALAAGKHVLVEKPVALTVTAVERLAIAARAARTLCMPAMCMRFWPGWDFLHDRIAAGTFGAPKSATFARVGVRPSWSPFYSDATQCGGPLFDLHVHDADFVRWCFGEPQSVAAFGTLEHFTASYRFDGGPLHATAEAGWDPAPGFPFRMRATVMFEEATVDFDLARDTPLLVARAGRVDAIELAQTNGYDGEVRHFLATIAAGRGELTATIDEAVGLTRMLEREAAALAAGGA